MQHFLRNSSRSFLFLTGSSYIGPIYQTPKVNNVVWDITLHYHLFWPTSIFPNNDAFPVGEVTLFWHGTGYIFI